MLALLGLVGAFGCNDPQLEADEPFDGFADPDPDESEPGPTIVCEPGEVRCGEDPGALEQCAATGLAWESLACGEYQQCEPCFADDEGECLAACVGPCERLSDDPSSAGCSFMSTGSDAVEALFVSNPDPDRTATVELRLVPDGSNREELGLGPIALGPGESRLFSLPNTVSDDPWASASTLGSGDVRRVVANLPVSVRRHTPDGDPQQSGASLALPDHLLGHEYVVYGFPPAYQLEAEAPPVAGRSAFTIIALDDQTTVRWWPTAATAGDGLPVEFVAPGEMGKQRINRFDRLRIAASAKHDAPICGQDLSGTVVVADRPIWLESSVRASVPKCPSLACAEQDGPEGGCEPAHSDLMIEQNLPIALWGSEYLAPHAPLRGGDEAHVWRVFAGDDDVTIQVTPEAVSPPISLAKRGDWVEFSAPADLDLRFVGDGRFMPVQYISGFHASDVQEGGPAMLQMVPTSAYLDRYAFELRTPAGEAQVRHVVAITRPAGGADVHIDGLVIDEWATLDTWEIAHLELDDGEHLISSAEPVGAMLYGYRAAVGDGAAGFACMLGVRG